MGRGQGRGIVASGEMVKTTLTTDDQNETIDDLLPAYHFDYSAAKPNRFAADVEHGGSVIRPEPDVAAVTMSEAGDVHDCCGEEAMEAHRIETTLMQDGTLVLDNLPFQAGEVVEVIILAQPARAIGHTPYGLRGTPVRYEQPTDPVASGDWEAAQ